MHPAAFFLIGPTATGKTNLAHQLALQRSATILSADAMLVYRGMDIGTAKPSPAMREEVPYGGIDLVDPDKEYNTGAYVNYARQFIRDHQQDPLIVVGGTGLYIKALTQGLTVSSGKDPELRAWAEGTLEKEGLSALQKIVQERNPLGFHQLKDNQNPRRLIRVLEQADANDLTRGLWKEPPSVPLIGLKIESEVLYKRIEERVRGMYASGLVDEVKQLKEHYSSLSGTALQAIGYAEAFNVLENRITPEEAIEKTIQRTRRLAKKQMTWFRNQAHVHWLEVGVHTGPSSGHQAIAELWNEHGPVTLNV